MRLIELRIKTIQASVFLPILLVSLVLVSCSIGSYSDFDFDDSTNVPPTSTSLPIISTDTYQAQPTSIPQDLSEDVETAVSEKALYSTGSRLFVNDNHKPESFGPPIPILWTYNSTDELARPVPGIVSPSHRFLAFYTADELENKCLSPSLGILDLTTRKVSMTIPLLYPEFADSVVQSQISTSCFQIEDQYPLLRALKWPTSLAWSEHGDFLSFVAAIDGPTADIYVADPSSGEVKRIASDPLLSTRPIWSPDGEFIIHSSVRDFIPAEEGQMGGPFINWGPVFASEVATETSWQLYDTSTFQDLPEAFIEWTSSREYLADSAHPPCGYKDLRLIDLLSGEIRIIWPYTYIHRAYAPELQAILVSVPHEEANHDYCQYTEAPGMYLIDISSGDVEALTDEASDNAWWGSVVWSSSDKRFLASTPHGVIAIYPDGTTKQIGPQDETDLFLAPSGSVAALDTIHSGLVIILRGDEQLLFPDVNPYAISWSRSGDSLAYFLDELLYTSRAPDYKPYPLIADDWKIQPTLGAEVIWVELPQN